MNYKIIYLITLLKILVFGSEDYGEIKSRLDSQVCEQVAGGREEWVCCKRDDCDETDEDSPCYRPSIEEEKCGLAGLLRRRRRRRGTGRRVRRAVGGEDSGLGEFPFMALLRGDIKGRPEWYCGGTLINKWYVLSAAQCGRVKVDYVRLGEWKVVDPDSYTTTATDDIFESDPKVDCVEDLCSEGVQVRSICQEPDGDLKTLYKGHWRG